MRTIKHGIFFFLLSKILAVNALQKNPTYPIQYNGQNSGANSWPSQSMPPEMIDHYNSNPAQSTYLNNNVNQQPMNYAQYSNVPLPYNNAQQYLTSQEQLTPQKQNYLPQIYSSAYQQIPPENTFQPLLTETSQIAKSNPILQNQSKAPPLIPKGPLNSHSQLVYEQLNNMQYPKFNQNENTKLIQPTTQKNKNQQLQVPQSYNLLPSSQSGQEEPQSFGTNVLSPPKKYQKKLSTSLNHPIPNSLPDFGELQKIGESQDFSKTQENKQVQVPSKEVPQLSQQTSYYSKPTFSSNQFLPLSSQNQLPLSQIPLQSYSKPLDDGSSTSNKNDMEIENDETFDSPSDLSEDTIYTPELPSPTQNQINLPQSSTSNSPITNQLPLTQTPLQSSSELLEDGSSTSNINDMEIENDETFDSPPDLSEDTIYTPELPSPTQNQINLPQSSTSNSPITNQLPLTQTPLQSSSEPLDKGLPTMEGIKDGVSLSSLPGFLDDESEPLISNVVLNENILADNSLTDMQTFLNPKNDDSLNVFNNVSDDEDNSKLESNNTPSQDQDVVIIEPQPDDLIKDMYLYDDIETLQDALDNYPLLLDKESKLEYEISRLSDFPVKYKEDSLHSLENVAFDKPLEEGLIKYDKSCFEETENPRDVKQDNAKITMFANPNDVHTLLLSPEQPSTSDNSYPNNNYILNTPSTDIPLYKLSFPNTVDYVQQSNSNTNNQPLSSLLNFNQNPLFYNQNAIYPPNNNYYNQQDPYSVVGQNRIISKTQLPSLSPNANPPSSKTNSGCIYNKVDLTNPSPNSSNSWLLLNKDYTKNRNRNNAYTSDDKILANIYETPSMSYQNNNQGILSSSSNDMFVQNMMSVISNSLQVPLVGTKAIFDVTRANFPRAPVSHIIRLTHAIVRSVILNLRQTLNAVMNTLYDRRSKRAYNPSGTLFKLPGALINKYSQQSTTAPTANNMNVPYYTQPDKTGQQSIVDFSVNQPIDNILQQQQTYYGAVTDMNYYGSQNNDKNRVMPQPANTQNYVLNSLVNAITTAIRSNVPDPYSINSREVIEYTQQVIVIAEIVFKNQIDNIVYGNPPTMNIY